MAWQNCVNNIRGTLDPNAKEIGQVDWANISQDALDNDTFEHGKPFTLVCPGRHCTEGLDQSPQAHRVCNCQDINGNSIPNCSPKDNLYPYKGYICLNVNNPSEYYTLRSRACTRKGETFYQLTCYCCCSCFAYGTKIGVPDGFKKIEQFEVGNRVLTADVESNGAGIKLNWTTARVSFSSGTGPDSHQSMMVYIHHGDSGSIIVTPDHLFLMPNGKLKRADRLVPGRDQLVSSKGQAVPIQEISVGEYHGGVHHIATEKEFTGDPNGHLLLSEGVVSGDFNLQIHAAQLKENHFVDDHDDLPRIGTPEYEIQHVHLASASYGIHQTAETAQSAPVPKPQKFYVHGENVASIPETAAKYLSSLQELDVNDNADKLAFTDIGMCSSRVKYVLRLFKGFYPDIVFYHDVGRLEPNAYAFTQYGEQVVVLSGGLTRIKGLDIEGLSLILSHMVTRLQKSEPFDNNGYTSVAMTDYYSTAVLQTVFFGTYYSKTYKSGLKQLEEKIFANIDQKHDKYEQDPYTPGKEVRLDAMDAGYVMDYPPPGIGGPTWGGLKVTGAKALPPELTPTSFVSEDITAEMSTQVYKDLQEHNVLDAQGVLADDFGLDTDLHFLFENQPEKLDQLLTSEVRYVLLHVGSKVQVSFNVPIKPGSALDVDDYELEPEAKVSAVEIREGESSIATLTAHLQRDVEYTLTVARSVRAADSSTLDPENDTATFKLIR